MVNTLSIQDIHKAFGSTQALKGISFDVARGEIVALLGPSGCGKSTLLNLVAGLEPYDRGDIRWEGKSLQDVPPHKRGFGLMFQDYALFPHLDVARNVAFGLKYVQVPSSTPGKVSAGKSGQARDPKSAEAHVRGLLELVGLAGYEQRAVDTLSGGEQQRVALARSLAPGPRLLMLDEPLGALDRTLRERLMSDLGRILRSVGQTALYVTHDQEEAFALADRVVVMRAGLVEQVDAPQEIYRRPKTEFVARFLGFDNILELQVQGTTLKTPAGVLPDLHQAPQSRRAFKALIRPDGAVPSPDGPQDAWEGVVMEKTFRGSLQRVTLTVRGTTLQFEFPVSVEIPETGAGFVFKINPEAVQLFEREPQP